MATSLFKIGDKTLESRLFLGTGKFGSNIEMEEAILASESELVTVALKRIDLETDTDAILNHLKHPRINLLPNTIIWVYYYFYNYYTSNYLNNQ